jgi:hypothetical protein
MNYPNLVCQKCGTPLAHDALEQKLQPARLAQPMPGADWAITMRRMMNGGCSKRECTCKPENEQHCIWFDELGDRPTAAPPVPAGMAMLPIPGLIWAVASKEKNEVYAMFDTPEQANAFVEALKAPLEAAELAAKETP